MVGERHGINHKHEAESDPGVGQNCGFSKLATVRCFPSKATPHEHPIKEPPTGKHVFRYEVSKDRLVWGHSIWQCGVDRVVVTVLLDQDPAF